MTRRAVNASRTYDGRRVVISNTDRFTDTVVVNTAFAHRRRYDVGTGGDVDRARAVIVDATEHGRNRRRARPDVLLMDSARSSVNLRVRWWIAPPKRADALVLFHDHTEDSDGDRGRQREGWPAGQAYVPTSRQVADAIAQISWSTTRRGDDE